MNILVATDDSPYSQSAIDSVLLMDCGSGSEIKVVTAVDLFELPLVLQQAKVTQEAHKHISAVVTRLRSALPQTKISSAVLEGHVNEMILQAAQDFKADLIVMGSHGRKGLSRFLLGSVSRAVLERAPCAVRIVRQTAADTIAINNHVLIALDQSKHSQQALEHVLNSKWPDGTRFKCITVVSEQSKHMYLDPAHVTGLSMHHDELVANAGIVLSQQVARLNRTFGSGTASFEVLEGEVRLCILEAAEKWQAGLIVMGSRGRKMMAGLFLGTVSEAVASHARCSVEITRVQTNEEFIQNQTAYDESLSSFKT